MRNRNMGEGMEQELAREDYIPQEPILSFLIADFLVERIMHKVNEGIDNIWVKAKSIPYSSEFWIVLFEKFMDIFNVAHDKRLDDININEYDITEAKAAVCDFHSNRRIERKPEWDYIVAKEK